MMNSKIVRIKLENCCYDIIINDNGFDFSSIAPVMKNRKVAIISNETVAPIYLNQLRNALPVESNNIYAFTLPDGEAYKNDKSWLQILDFLADNNFNRSDLLVSLGGGVICDMTGFAAASWMRGIDFIQVPTSLLAQVDASVGGKTGINHKKGKNLIGAFHQPKAVIINTATLKTLPEREFKSGMGETIKYGLINQIEFKQWLESHSTDILNQDLSILTQLIAQCCQFKAEIVQQDEKESGIRALLNLGHTFGHAIETHTNYVRYTHGEAVAIGMVMAAELSDLLKLSDGTLRKETQKHLQDFQLLSMLPTDIDAHHIVRLMRFDKKVVNNNHRLILMKALGDAIIQQNVCEQDILKAIKNCQ
ncbi:MAG: 3-dehydroquinate synthase [Marinicellaceae bacterium]